MTGYLESIKIRNETLEVHQELMYYYGSNGDGRASGAYIFRPAQDRSEAVSFGETVDIKVYRGEIFDEVHQQFSNWTQQVMRVYKEMEYIEFDWIVGPIDIRYLIVIIIHGLIDAKCIIVTISEKK